MIYGSSVRRLRILKVWEYSLVNYSLYINSIYGYIQQRATSGTKRLLCCIFSRSIVHHQLVLLFGAQNMEEYHRRTSVMEWWSKLFTWWCSEGSRLAGREIQEVEVKTDDFFLTFEDVCFIDRPPVVYFLQIGSKFLIYC